MNRLNRVLIFGCFILLGITLALPAVAKNNTSGKYMKKYQEGLCSSSIRQNAQMLDIIQALPFEPVSDIEEASLLKMLEEEKLARDVYLHLAEKWGVRAFSRIAISEQNHMNAIVLLLEKYEIGFELDTVVSGVFVDEVVQSLYDDLIADGELTELDALIVGATIEDLDINDLMVDMETVDNEDIIFVYKNLLKGSQNHLRGFYRLLTDMEGEYFPQYISEEVFTDIVNSSAVKGLVE